MKTWIKNCQRQQRYLAIANIFIHYWPLIIIALVAIVYGIVAYSATDAGKRIADRFKMKVPIFGQLFMLMYMARFSRTASTLLSSGVQKYWETTISAARQLTISTLRIAKKPPTRLKAAGRYLKP